MEPSVRIAQGALQGKVMTSRKGRRIHAFQGIPYAEPPVAELRFQVCMEFFTFAVAFFICVFVQDPRGAPGWSGVRLAQKEGNCCVQNHFFKKQYVGSEDCLYLNVYAPPVSIAFLSPSFVMTVFEVLIDLL
jgi:para-nitrobenzyl esterase